MLSGERRNSGRPSSQLGDRLAGQVVVGHQPAAVGRAVERRSEQCLEDRRRSPRRRRAPWRTRRTGRPRRSARWHRCCSAPWPPGHRPGWSPGRVRGGPGSSARSSTTMAKMLVPALTLPVRGATELVATMPGAGIALGRAQSAPGRSRAGRVEQLRAGLGELPRGFPGDRIVGSSVASVQLDAGLGGQPVEACQHARRRSRRPRRRSGTCRWRRRSRSPARR